MKNCITVFVLCVLLRCKCMLFIYLPSNTFLMKMKKNLVIGLVKPLLPQMNHGYIMLHGLTMIFVVKLWLYRNQKNRFVNPFRGSDLNQMIHEPAQVPIWIKWFTNPLKSWSESNDSHGNSDLNQAPFTQVCFRFKRLSVFVYTTSAFSTLENGDFWKCCRLRFSLKTK